MTIAQYKIKKYMNDNNKTQKDIAKKLGSSVQVVTNLLLRDKLPSRLLMYEYEELFNIKNKFGSYQVKTDIKLRHDNVVKAHLWFKMETGADVSYPTFMNWIEGKARPDQDMYRTYCHFFNIYSEWLIISNKCLYGEHKNTVAQSKILAMINGENRKTYAERNGIKYSIIENIIAGHMPNKKTQHKINDYFGIQNDLLNGVQLKKSIGQSHLDFVLDTGRRLDYQLFSAIIQGRVANSSHVESLCKHFGIINEYYI